MPPGLRRKIIVLGTRSAKIMASWPAPLTMESGSIPMLADRILRQRAQASVHGHRGLVHQHFTHRGEAAPFGDRHRLGEQVVHRLVANRILSMAYIEAGAQLSGNDIPRSRVGAQIADGGHHARRRQSHPLHLADPLCRPRDGIVAQPHRRRAGMTGPAGKGDLRAGLAGDRLHYPERPIFAFQQHALLDVELEVPGHIVA